MLKYIISRSMFMILLIINLSVNVFPQEGKTLPFWQEGYLDIHAINTGLGECSFFIFPDGTTMLVDAGAILESPPRSKIKPNDSRSPGEWIARYISHMLKPLPEKKLNYILLSHFHWDHMGGISPDMKISTKGDYILSGITEVADNILFDKMIDRNWPKYDWPVVLNDEKMKNYKAFLEWQIENNNPVVEQFKTGRNDQIVLLNKAKNYPSFEVRNIAANGYVWSGIGNGKKNYFPDIDHLSKKDYPSENNLSIALRISYNDFDYFTGGDISFRGAEYGNPSDNWKNIEDPVAIATGPVDVLKANHHANYDANGAKFLSILSPRVIIIHSWLANQPSFSTWRRLMSKEIYYGPRDIYCTNIHNANKLVFGSEIDSMESQQGHIVIRVFPGGKSYLIYVLNDQDESFTIKSIHGPYNSK